MTAASSTPSGAHQPHHVLAETPPAPPAAPTGRRAYWYSATAEELAGRVRHHPRHSATLPPDPPPFRLRD